MSHFQPQISPILLTLSVKSLSHICCLKVCLYLSHLENGRSQMTVRTDIHNSEQVNKYVYVRERYLCRLD